MNTSQSNPIPPPNTGDTDIDEIRTLLSNEMVNVALRIKDRPTNSNVVEDGRKIMEIHHEGLDSLMAAITKKLRSERLDELNRAAFTIVSTLHDDIDNLFDHSDIQEVFEAYQKLRAIELQATKENNHGGN